MAKPVIRLKGYCGEWRTLSIGECGIWLKGKSLSKSDLQADGAYPCIHYGELFVLYDEVIRDVFSRTNLNSESLSTEGDLLFPDSDVTPNGLARCSAIMKNNVVLGGGINILRTDPQYYAPFLSFSINTEKEQIIRNVTGTTVKHINSKALSSISLSITDDFSEQYDIAHFFESLNGLIKAAGSKVDSLKQQKSACLLSMFPQDGETVPRIRFKGFQDDWQSTPLREISKKVTKKNKDLLYKTTFTNSAQFGIIDQLDFFDHEISKSERINNYYVVENDDFVYNPRISTSAPVGPINRNQLGYTGVMSPLYYVFRVFGIDKDFLSCYFKTTIWHKFMRDNGNSGARFDRLSIADDVFVKMPILHPKDPEEQRMIASFFRNLDTQISLHQQRLEKLKQIKSACLDKMFV